VTYGQFRDGFPRLTLSLPGRDGIRSVEFIVDTGFDGEIALPSELLRDLDAAYAGDHPILLADRTYRRRSVHRILLEWGEEDRETEIIEMDGNPLIGNGLLRDNLVEIEMREGGEVAVEPL
jgi:clan AA aspartic protease